MQNIIPDGTGAARALSSPSTKLAIDTLKLSLEDSVDQRGRYYEDVFAFTIRFGMDDSKAARDTKHF
ncbi:hypothetical protein MMC19_001702 [Ptychographa xylographoides]|nr:hypothetical protein [Ptychographa xylographoides]